MENNTPIEIPFTLPHSLALGKLTLPRRITQEDYDFLVRTLDLMKPALTRSGRVPPPVITMAPCPWCGSDSLDTAHYHKNIDGTSVLNRYECARCGVGGPCASTEEDARFAWGKYAIECARSVVRAGGQP